MTEVKDHLNLQSIGKDVATIGQNRKDTKEYSIPQIDGIMDSRDSLSVTPESVDLTVSPEKCRNEYVNRKDKDNDTNDKDLDRTVDFHKEKAVKKI